VYSSTAQEVDIAQLYHMAVSAWLDKSCNIL
jgi:hypothetical protein